MALLGRPPLRFEPSSSDIQIGYLLSNLWTQLRGKVTRDLLLPRLLCGQIDLEEMPV